VEPAHLLRFQCVIRSYGALSTTVRRRFGWVRKAAASDSPSSPTVAIIQAEESEFLRVRKRSWARLIAKTWLEDPVRCPSCGKEMKILAAISSPAQDDVIERILRARGEWDPPWLRSHPPRGPPASVKTPHEEEEVSIDDLPPDETYCVDPDPGWDS